MRRRTAHTDLDSLLEMEKEARERAATALKDLLSIYTTIEQVGKDADRKNYNDSRYRRARWQFTAFLNRVRGNRRILLGALGAMEGVSAFRYTSPDTLIASVQTEDDAKEERKKRRQTRTTRSAVNA